MKAMNGLAKLVAAFAVYFAGAGVASAAICTGQANNNVLYGEVPEASACTGMSQGNDAAPGDVTVFGFTWTFLDKNPEAGNPFEGALTVTGAGGLSGTWSINTALLGGLYNTFVISLKPDGGFGYFLVGNTLSGTWSTDTPDSLCAAGGAFAGGNCAGFGLSHISLYGRLTSNGGGDVPEPATSALLLLGFGLLGMSFVARRRGHRS